MSLFTSHKTRAFRQRGSAVLLTLIACTLALPARAFQEASTNISPAPAIFEVGMGQVETLNIYLENAQDIYGIDVRARFDPKAVQVFDADTAKDGVQMIPGNFIKPDFLVYNTADNQAGSLMYVITQINPSQPVTGDGVVISILVQGLVLGESTFTIDFVQVSDRYGKLLPITPQSGTIKVVPPRPPTPTPPVEISPDSTGQLEAANAVEGTLQPTSGPRPTMMAGVPGETGSDNPGRSQPVKVYLWIITISFIGAAILLLLAALLFLRRSSRKRES